MDGTDIDVEVEADAVADTVVEIEELFDGLQLGKVCTSCPCLHNVEIPAYS